MRDYLIEEQFIHEGYPCAVVFTNLGHRCGYVGIPQGHPAYGKDCDEINVQVHGGLTYAQDDQDGYPTEGQDRWWFGFDCAHFGDGQDLELARRLFKDPSLDFLIKMEKSFSTRQPFPVRSKDYVVTECMRLAEQLKDMEKAPGGGR